MIKLSAILATATLAVAVPAAVIAHGAHGPERSDGDCVLQRGPAGTVHSGYAVSYGDGHWHTITTFRDRDGDGYGEPYNATLGDYRDAYAAHCEIDADYFSRVVFVHGGQSILSPSDVTDWWLAGRPFVFPDPPSAAPAPPAWER